MTPNPCATHFLSDFIVTAGNVSGSEIISFTTTEAKAGGINARSVQVRWQSTDLGILSLLSPTPMLSSTSREPSRAAPITFPTKMPESTTLKLGTSAVSFGLISHPATIQTTTASNLVSVPPNSSHTTSLQVSISTVSVSVSTIISTSSTRLSQSTSVYLGVSVAIVTAILAAIFLAQRVYRRRRRRRTAAAIPIDSNSGPVPVGEIFELDNKSKLPPELEGFPIVRHELYGDNQLLELGGESCQGGR